MRSPFPTPAGPGIVDVSCSGADSTDLTGSQLPDLLPLADRDVDYALQLNRRLTDALKHAAQANKVGYVDVLTASKGHDICADDPWINGQVTDPARAQSFHPFLAEQTAVAELVVAALR